MSTVSLLQPANASDSGIISPFLSLTATGLDRSTSASSKEAQLAFWFSIAEGELWGAPHWGHPLKARLFMSGTDNDLIAAEMRIIRKLLDDIPSLQISAVKASFESSDLITFTIYYIDGGVQAMFKESVKQ